MRIVASWNILTLGMMPDENNYAYFVDRTGDLVVSLFVFEIRFYGALAKNLAIIFL